MVDSSNSNNECWVFGYGSLCWHPGFKYKRSMVGHVKGFSRRFWQGNTTHRGTAEKPERISIPKPREERTRYLSNYSVNSYPNKNPGRVATLIEEKEGIVHGRAFQVQDNTALPYLKNRECTLGGYVTTLSTFYSRDGDKDVTAIIFIATCKNEQWLGEAPLNSIATQISECSGPSGHNVEYLLRLAEFMHRYLPEAQDEHLFTLELLVRSRIKEENMCLRLLMGDRNFRIDLDNEEMDVSDEDELDEDDDANNLRENTFQFILRVPDKTLRCLKM
ncbi:putative glutathione-specific gamma-glutamylcyclotransferase 2 isoform X1 [Colletes latitarsis]|uniref:putative glutathione-specific gamma-glutamylcyclotransferase 2 isoform X1 n=1 Tax=Colletes latitarsis TaxID=2605962 RepID=UPI004035DCA5